MQCCRSTNTNAFIIRYDVRDGESQSEADARNPEVAVKMRDPMNVTKKYPMPEGAHFCGPVAVEGSEPFRDMAPGTNAFDYTQGRRSSIETLSHSFSLK